ncbi:glycosyltransferase family A protein [Rhizobium sullae]|uniref:glycosyltransferase family A protein n=1 Tax=Rhizobium sullae TaxID=50338 RepID=UPI000B35636F|nr:glycosyltransferase family A protein [Rhizobium sullae]
MIRKLLPRSMRSLRPAKTYDVDVTIGVPCFNGRKTLERALDSALGQTYRGAYEIIVVNDGSTDTTANIAKAYELRFPDYIRLITTSNKGVAAARNEIIKSARGEYLTWLDADDAYFPTKIAAQIGDLKELEKKSGQQALRLVMSEYRINGNNSNVRQYLADPIRHVLTGELRAYLWATMARTSIYKVVGPFNQKLHRSEDQDWLLRFLRKGGKIQQRTRQPLMHYSFSTSRNGKHVEESLHHILSTYGRLLDKYGIRAEFEPRRYWEIAGFYKANKKWDDMWRCRGMAVKKDFDTYFPKLIGEVIREMDQRDSDLGARVLSEVEAFRKTNP